jgi:hypothetical protein
MTCAEFIVRIVLAVLMLTLLTDKNTFIAGDLIFKILGTILILHTLWTFFIVKAEYYALEKIDQSDSDASPRDCCFHSLAISDYSKQFTMIIPPYTWLDLIVHILFAVAGIVIISYLNSITRLPNGILYLLYSIVTAWFASFLFNFLFPKADYYFMQKN